jgi:hypothetical protein
LSAASDVSASMKKPPKSVAYCSAPLRVAVHDRPARPERSATNGPLALAVLMNTICLVGSLVKIA